MRCFDAICCAVPLPIALVAAAMAVHALPRLPPAFVADVLLVGGLLGLAWARADGRHGLRLLAIALAGAGWTIGEAERGLAERLTVAQEGRDYAVVGRVAAMPMSAERGTRFLFDIERCVVAIEDCPAGRRVRLSWYAFGVPPEHRDEETASAPGCAPRVTGSGVDARPVTACRAVTPTPQPGERWRLNVRLKRVHALHNPNAFDAELRALEEGIAANGYVRSARKGMQSNERLGGHAWNVAIVFESARTRLREAMHSALEPARADAAGVLVALVVGDQAAIPAFWWDVFNRTGIGHLMSISGLHITMLAGLAVAASRRLLRTRVVARSGLLLRCPAQRLAWLVGIVVAFAYAGLAGWGIPAQRTCWMLAVAGVALFSGRGRRVARILSLAAGIVTILDPWAPLAAGFWLSFAAVAAITLHGCAGRAREAPHEGTRMQRLRAVLVEAARTQWAATLALVPLGALFFASVSLVGPVANAFAIPLVSAVITPLAIGAAALLAWLPVVGGFVLLATAHVTGWLLDSLAWLSAYTWATTSIAAPSLAALVFSVIAVALLLIPARLPARPLAFGGLLPLLAASGAAPPAGALRITAFDVGQGMAVLVETPDRRLLYDTGPLYGGDSEAGARVILPWLRARAIDRLDALVVSHLDSDHSGGTASLLRSLRIGWIAGSLPFDHPARTAGIPFHDCRRGEGWQWGEVAFEFLHPEPDSAPGTRVSTNASSCVLRIESPSATLLLAGDIEAAQERVLIAREGAERLRADLLLAPHHGSGTSSSVAFLEAVGARHAIAQVGYRNRFRHPAPRVVARYEAAGIELLRSDRDGMITIEYAKGRAPAIARSRIDDRRYWRIRVEDDAREE